MIMNSGAMTSVRRVVIRVCGRAAGPKACDRPALLLCADPIPHGVPATAAVSCRASDREHKIPGAAVDPIETRTQCVPRCGAVCPPPPPPPHPEVGGDPRIAILQLTHANGQVLTDGAYMGGHFGELGKWGPGEFWL